jgi:CheY-like chemotaxis protein
MKNSSPTIFYLEDDLEDMEILDYVGIILGIKAKIVHFQDGDKGLKKLLECKRNNTLPSMVLVDVNMPLLNGMEVISKLKEDEVLKDLPTVVLSTSTNDKPFFDKLNIEMVKKPSGDVKRFLDDMKRVFAPYVEMAPVAILNQPA